MSSSNFWLFIIIVCAAVLAMANIKMSRSIASEEKTEKAKHALAILKPELIQNHMFILNYKRLLDNGIGTSGRYFTTAWKTVSGSEMIMGLQNSLITELLTVYELMIRANDIMDRILEGSIGISSALKNAPDNVKRLVEALSLINEDILKRLGSLLEKNI